MRLRPVFLTVAAVAALGVLGMAGWDFLQLGRTIPPLAPAPERATSIVVEKSLRRVSLMRGATPIKPMMWCWDQVRSVISNRKATVAPRKGFT